ncbi:MAG: hypothetical protein MK183_01140 [Verrucomicrobiales bacterium]|nr:hypothetical protein [Verrucomicrobiales bacterium]
MRDRNKLPTYRELLPANKAKMAGWIMSKEESEQWPCPGAVGVTKFMRSVTNVQLYLKTYSHSGN